MKRLILFYFMTCLAYYSLSAQDHIHTQVYKMEALGTEIGSVYTSYRTAGKDTYYHTESLLEVNLVFKKIRMEVEGNAHFRSGKLIKSANSVMVNGELHTSSSITWQGDGYETKVDGELMPKRSTPVHYSGTMLYFEEPVGIAEALSESSGILMKITPLSVGKYRVKDPNTSRDMVCYYENGIQTKVEIKHPILTVYITRQNTFADRP